MIREVVKVGIAKLGCIGTLPLLEFLLDERADRKDIDVRVIGSGAKMGKEQAKDVARRMLDVKPDLAIVISPNATLPGPKVAREMIAEAGIPTIVISDKPTAKIRKELEEKGFGYIIVNADSMIGARREFLDPVEMALYNADIIRVLAVTGALSVVYKEIDRVIESIKIGERPRLPHVSVGRDAALAAGFENPYARAKAMAAYEVAEKVADVTVLGCFVVRESEKYVPLVAEDHEMMRTAALLADEAREAEKGADSVLREPHASDGTVLRKRRLAEKPVRPG